MLALIGYEGDAVCEALSRAADRAGLPAARVRDPAAWRLTVQLDGDGRSRVDLRSPEGVPVTCAVNRLLPPQPGLGPGESSDVLATWWAALALLPGRVVNRPGRQGFVPSPPLPAARLTTTLTTTPAATPAATTAATTTTSQTTTTAQCYVANVHDAHTGHFLYRAAGEHPPAPQAGVLRITPFDPARTWRLMLAGDQVVALHVPPDANAGANAGAGAGGLTARDREIAAAATRSLKRAGLGLALVVLSRAADDTTSEMRTVAVNPLPSLPHYHGHEERVHDAVLGWLKT